MNPSIIITLKGEPCNAREEVVERFREIAKHHFKDYTFWTSTSSPREKVIGMTPRMSPEPTPPTVPLGPNRTRDGREVRVIANDVKGKYPVVIVLPQDGREIVSKRRKDGTSSIRSSGDLVGHLPPEPPKPREIWLCEELNGDDQVVWDTEQTNIAHGRKQTHFREVVE